MSHYDQDQDNGHLSERACAATHKYLRLGLSTSTLEEQHSVNHIAEGNISPVPTTDRGFCIGLHCCILPSIHLLVFLFWAANTKSELKIGVSLELKVIRQSYLIGLREVHSWVLAVCLGFNPRKKDVTRATISAGIVSYVGRGLCHAVNTRIKIGINSY